MIRDEIYATVAAVDLANPYAKTKEPQDVIALVNVLELALSDVPQDFATKAIAEAVRRGKPLRTASEIAGLWSADNNRRLTDAQQYLVPPPEVLDDTAQWKRWTLSARQGVLDGAAPAQAVARANQAVGLPAELESSPVTLRDESVTRLNGMARQIVGTRKLGDEK